MMMVRADLVLAQLILVLSGDVLLLPRADTARCQVSDQPSYGVFVTRV